MKNLIKYLPYIFIFFAGIWIRGLFIQPCPGNSTIIETTIERDTVYTTETIIKEVKVPKPIFYETIIKDTIIDTIEVIKDYHTKKVYNDTLQNDTLAYINIKDTLYKNEIIYRQYEYINRTPTLIMHQETQVKRSCKKVWLGIDISQSSLEGTISLLKGNNSMYGIGVDITKLQPEYLYGIHFKYSKGIINFK